MTSQLINATMTTMKEPIKIEKGIPIPNKKSGHGPNMGAPRKYPIHLLSVGESFLAKLKKSSQLSASISQFRKKYPNKKFTCRKVEGGVRVWRVK